MINWPTEKEIGDIYTNPSGVSWKWSGKAWISLRESEVIYLPVPGATGSVGATGSSGASVIYQFSHSIIDPLDETTYYIGNVSDSPPQSSVSIPFNRMITLTSGIIEKLSIMSSISGNLGDGESQKFTIKNYTTGDSSIITDNYKNLTSSQSDNYVLSEPLVVSEGDELEIIWETNIFSISPTLVRNSINAFIEYYN